MSDRRKLSESLSVKERKFLGQDTSPTTTESKPLTDAPPNPPQPTLAKKSRWVPVTTRLPEEIVHQLKMVCREREDAGIEPSTRQDILTEALSIWFTEFTDT